MTGKCAVCGKEGEVFVASSECGAMTLAYCGDCLDAGAEPWNLLVQYVSLAGHYPDDINEQYREIIRDTCAHLGKTEQEFADAVEEAIKEFDEICKNYGVEVSKAANGEGGVYIDGKKITSAEDIFSVIDGDEF